MHVFIGRWTIGRYNSMSKPVLETSKQQPLNASMSDGLVDPVSRFMFGLKAPETRRQYPRRLEVFLDFIVAIAPFGMESIGTS